MNRPPKMPKVLGPLSSIIEVDGGRGFIVERQKNRFVLTVAHCLPHLPPCSLMSHGEERTYKHSLGVIGQHAKVWAQCLFADPVSDIAILGSPDYQTFFEQSDQWKTFIQALKPIPIRRPRLGETIYMLSLRGEFVSGVIHSVNEQFLNIESTGDLIQPGMSGSPILNEDGHAVSLCSVNDSQRECAALNLQDCLPFWF